MLHNLIIGICSCHQYAERRAAIRETWLKSLPANIFATFFVGKGPEPTEKEIVVVSAPDDYENLPKKVQSFLKYVLSHHEFEYLFKCDDDTYLFPERLLDLLKDRPDFVGSADYFPSHADGGAGYLVSCAAVQVLAEASCPEPGEEDVWVTTTLRRSNFSLLPCSRLLQDYRTIPDRPARIVTAHQCSPDLLRRIYQWPPDCFTSKNVTFISCYARHNAWAGTIKLYSNGFFVGGPAKPNGRWEVGESGNWLSLDWFDWPREVLQKTSLGYANSDLQIEFPCGPESFTDSRQQTPH